MNNEKEKGAVVIVEATFVFPIMLFVIFSLLYMGNVYYQQAKLNSVIDRAAIIGAAYAADPFLDEIESAGSVPTSNNDIQPYRYLFGVPDAEKKVNDFVDKNFQRAGDGFFGKMSPINTSYSTKFNNHIVTMSFTVEGSYDIRVPLRFLGTEPPKIVSLSAKATAPITDNAEFINNLNMALDYADSTGLSKKISAVMDKVKSVFSFGK